MVKIKNYSDELNSFLSSVYISPVHATSFTGLDKFYHTVHNEKRNTKMGRKQFFLFIT